MHGAILIGFDELYKIPIWELEGPLEEKFVALKVITGDQFDREKLLIINSFGDWFSMSMNRSYCVTGSIKHQELQKLFGKDIEIRKTYEVYLWKYKGNIKIYSEIFAIENYDKPIPSIVLQGIKNKLDEYSKGGIDCSDCGKAIKREEIGGHYFAGSYCKECWLGQTGKYKGKKGWQEVERKENYR